MPAVAVKASDILAHAHAVTGSSLKAADICGVSHMTVLKAVKESGEDIASVKKEVAKQALSFGTALWQHSASKIDSMKPYEAGILGCAVIDKAAKLEDRGPLVAVNVIGELAGLRSTLDLLRQRAGQSDDTTDEDTQVQDAVTVEVETPGPAAESAKPTDEQA
jgi:hypothetical protein